MCLYVCERENNISFYVFLAFDQNFCVFFELHVWHFAPYTCRAEGDLSR